MSERHVKVIERAGPGGFVAVLAFIGAAVYFIQQTNGGFWEVVLALLQAAIWPLFVVYHVLALLGA